MKKILLIIVLGVFYSIGAFSQDSIQSVNIFDKLATPSNEGKVVLGGDSIKHIIEEAKPLRKTPLKGWRIRIYRDNSQNARTKAEGVMLNIKSNYPGVPVEIKHNSPYFYVEVGDYRTQDDAEKMRKRLSASYPALSLINVNIKLPPL